MTSINYSFLSLASLLTDFSTLGPVEKKKRELDIKDELNKFFKDSECLNVHLTVNTDKMFFGMKVNPEIDAESIYDYLFGNNNIRIDKYTVEIDSQMLKIPNSLPTEPELFDEPNPESDSIPTSSEVLAVLIYEVARITNDYTPMNLVRDYLNSYLADNKESFSISSSIHYKEILAYGIKDFISKKNSFFYIDNEADLRANDFIKACELDDDLVNAQMKIKKTFKKFYEDSDIAQVTVFAWTLRLYKSLRFRRVGALNLLNKAKLLTGSRIERAEMESLSRRILRIDDETILESVASRVKAKLRKMKFDAVRSLDDEYYELNMRCRNVEDEADALYLMRQINSKIGIISEYLNDKNLTESQKKDLFDSLSRFQELRDKLSKTAVYKSKAFGIYVNYPDLDD